MAEPKSLIAFRDPKMWERLRLDDGTYVWVFLCGSNCDEPWNATGEDES